MGGNKTDKLVKGAFLLTLAGFISKILSAGYRIPLQNLTGDAGFYIYQQIYPVLGMVMILTLYGFPSAISKLAAEMRKAGKELSVRNFYLPIFVILLVLGSGLFVFLYWSAPNLSHWIGDGKLENAYKLVAFTFFLIPFLAIPRGVFQEFGEMRPTAYSQVSEQIIRVVIIIAAAVWFAMNGENIYAVGYAGAFASIAAGMVSVGVLSYFFFKRRPFTRSTYPIPWLFYMKSLLVFGLFFALNHMLLIIIQFADAFTLLPGLLEYGMSKIPAMETKGIFDRGQPFIQFGAVIGSSFSLALIPNVSRLKSETGILHRNIRSALSISTYIGFGATLGLILIFPFANQLLYKNTAGTGSLQILVASILLSSLAITVSSVLQGLGYMKRTALYTGYAFLTKWGLNMLLVPLWGITGSAFATVCSLLLLTGCVFYELYRRLPMLRFFGKLNWRALFISSLGMTVYIFIVHYMVSWFYPDTRLDTLLYVAFVVITGGLLYLYLLLKWKAFSEEELAMLPLAHVFIRIQRGRHSNGTN